MVAGVLRVFVWTVGSLIQATVVGGVAAGGRLWKRAGWPASASSKTLSRPRGGVLGAVVVDTGGMVVADADVAWGEVGRRHEVAHPGTGVLEALEALGVVGPVPDGLEHGLGAGVVVAGPLS